jgi:hydrogenase expression/formation protein HypC
LTALIQVNRRPRQRRYAKNNSGRSDMCLAVPMQVVSCDGFTARCEAKGISRDVSLFLLQHEQVAPGDHVMVHVGFAIEKVTAEQARSTWELFDEMLTAEMEQKADA